MPPRRAIAVLAGRLIDAFLVGTESYFGSPSAWGFSVHDEPAELVGLGLSPAEALRAGTLERARALGMADSLGTVAVGRDE